MRMVKDFYQGDYFLVKIPHNTTKNIAGRDGETIYTIVNDDLNGLTYLEAKVSGILLPI